MTGHRHDQDSLGDVSGCPQTLNPKPLNPKRWGFGSKWLRESRVPGSAFLPPNANRPPPSSTLIQQIIICICSSIVIIITYCVLLFATLLLILLDIISVVVINSLSYDPSYNCRCYYREGV